MRIRTIKPEFWTHPVLSQLPAEVRLLAIGLLNYADDEGFFMADPRLVRAALFPFSEDSVSIHGGIIHLSNIGWIDIRQHPNMGPIGVVVNFRKHQNINRPNRSKIATYYNSLDIHGVLTESSVNNQCCIQGSREQGTGSGGEDREPPHPPVIDSVGETDPKERNRQALTKQLQRLGLSSSPEALIEWGNLLQGAGEVESAEESLAALRWIAKRAEVRGVKLRFARDAQELAKAWAKKRATEIDATEQLENTA